MLMPADSAQLVIMNERLRELRRRKDAAIRRGDEETVDELQTEIDELSEDCDKVIVAAQVP